MRLIDVHGHFYTDRCGRVDWKELNRRRLLYGERVGITSVVASILGTYGYRSPTYFPSREDVEHANSSMLDLQRAHRGRVFGYCLVNPNYADQAVAEIERCLDAGMIGVKLAASRRADDLLLEVVAQLAAERGVPILHHVWQHRRREWPGQEASDAAELATLALRHPGTKFIVAHLGGGGDWAHTLRVAAGVSNLWIDLSGSGVDRDMLDGVVRALSIDRLLWGCDLTIDTGWGKLRYLESLGLSNEQMAAIRHRNAETIFPSGAFDAN